MLSKKEKFDRLFDKACHYNMMVALNACAAMLGFLCAYPIVAWFFVVRAVFSLIATLVWDRELQKQTNENK